MYAITFNLVAHSFLFSGKHGLPEGVCTPQFSIDDAQDALLWEVRHLELLSFYLVPLYHEYYQYSHS